MATLDYTAKQVQRMSGFRDTLTRLANEADPHERARLSELLASQIEVRENDIANRTQTAIWGAQEDAEGKIGRAEAKIDRLNQQVGDNNTLISAFIAGQTRQAERIEKTLGEVARGLGKLAVDVVDLGEQLAESKEDRAGLHSEIADLRDLVESYLDPSLTPAAAKERARHYTQMLERHEAIFVWMVDRWPEIRDKVAGDSGN